MLYACACVVSFYKSSFNCCWRSWWTERISAQSLSCSSTKNKIAILKIKWFLLSGCFWNIYILQYLRFALWFRINMLKAPLTIFNPLFSFNSFKLNTMLLLCRSLLETLMLKQAKIFQNYLMILLSRKSLHFVLFNFLQ